METAIQKSDQEFSALLDSSRAKLAEVAPKWLTVDRLTKLALAMRSRSPSLAECTADSFLTFCMRCAETGLEPIGPGGAWPVPFWNRKVQPNKREVLFIPDWRGLIQLAKRAGQIKHAYGDIVKANDSFEYEKGDSPRCFHKPALANRGDTIGAYCVCVLPDDSKHVEWMNLEELDAIQGRSKAKDDGPWKTDPDAMRIKTVVKRGLKPFASSPQLHAAIELDNAATGCASILDRAPIMPTTAKVIETTATEPAKASATPPASASEGGQAETVEGQTVTGVCEALEPFTKKDDKGVIKYIKYAAAIDGNKYSTFDKPLGAMIDLHNGKAVTVTFKDDGKYKTLLAIVPVDPHEAVDGMGSDNLPFG